MKSVRDLHVYTWWILTSLSSIAIARSHNQYFALALVLLAGGAVHFYATDSAWRNSFRIALKIAAFVIAFRLIASALIGLPVPGPTLFTLPTLNLPHWMAGVNLGGPISQPRLANAFTSALLLAAVIALMGAAQSLTTPQRFLGSLPRFLYEFGLIIIIATTLIPQFFASVSKIREAHLIRGISPTGIQGFATPLIEESLERTLALAASMEVRGYGAPQKRSRYNSPFLYRENFGLIDLLLILGALAMVIVS